MQLSANYCSFFVTFFEEAQLFLDILDLNERKDTCQCDAWIQAKLQAQSYLNVFKSSKLHQ